MSILQLDKKRQHPSNQNELKVMTTLILDQKTEKMTTILTQQHKDGFWLIMVLI